jgi:hypothetical protein
MSDLEQNYKARLTVIRGSDGCCSSFAVNDNGYRMLEVCFSL